MNLWVSSYDEFILSVVISLEIPDIKSDIYYLLTLDLSVMVNIKHQIQIGGIEKRSHII